MYKKERKKKRKVKRRYLSPILCQVFKPLEGGDELEGNEPLLVPLDVLEKELILANVGVREVKLNLNEKRNLSMNV